MAKTITTRYDVAEHLRTPEEMAAYLEACLKRQMVTLLLLPKLWVISPAPRACHKWRVMPACPGKVFTERSLGNEARVSTQFLKL